MTCNIKVANQILTNIEMLLVDVGGTLLNYQELWLKQIGYLSQVLAENHSTVQGELFRTRAMVMKALGADPETGNIDYSSSLFTSNNSNLKVILSTILYLNNVSWINALESVEKTLIEMENEIDFTIYPKMFQDTGPFLKSFSDKLKIVTFSKRSYENSLPIMKHFKINTYTEKHFSLYDESTYEDTFMAYICDMMGVKAENTVILADSIYDLSLEENLAAHRVLVNRNSIDNYFVSKYLLKHLPSNLAEIEFAGEAK